MAGKVPNIKVCGPLILYTDLPEKKPVICHYSYNFLLALSIKIKGNLPLNQAHLADATHRRTHRNQKSPHFADIYIRD